MKKTFSFYISMFRESFVRYCREELQKMGLSQGLLYFLLYIGKHAECSQRELAAALRADEGHTARSVDRLVQGGFAERRKRQEGRKVCLLTLTERGEEAFARAHALFEEWDESMLRDLDPGGKERLFEVLELLTETRLKTMSERKGGGVHGSAAGKTYHAPESDA